MSGIKILLTLLISTITSNISFIQLSLFNCLQCFRDIRRLALNCLRIATILTSERSTDGVSRLLSKADLERLKLEKAKPRAKVAECLGLDFFLASHWVQNLQPV